MPIYEFQCEACGTRHEKLVMAKAQEIVCPKCASVKQAIQISVFSASTKAGGGASANSGHRGCGCTPRGCGCN